ncbi:DUF3006 domain-containing protein [Clostridium sp.]|uniref:DUF3006 domain-containing protein n=1 Tax=Clostridium sp. TaxID=1506 RepID=UPI002FC78400
MMLIIDRFGKSFAVCEDENGINHDIPISLISGEAKEGHLIEEINGLFYINKEETEKRRKYIKELAKNMWS